jgi:hypothetical protein
LDPEYSTLLIDDHALPTKGAQLRRATADVLMMLTLNTLERTSKQFEKLLRAAGLEIVNI